MPTIHHRVWAKPARKKNLSMKTLTTTLVLRRALVLSLGLVLFTGLSGCLRTFSLTLKPKADGSGTMEYTVELKQETLDMIREMKNDTSAAASENKSAGQGLEAQARMAADSSNGTVTFEHIDYIVRGEDTLGAKAIFHYKDITKIKPQDFFKSANPMGQQTEDNDSSGQVWTKFEIVKGHPAVLRVYSKNAEKITEFGGLMKSGDNSAADTKSKKKGKKAKDEDNPFALMFAQMLDSLQMDLAIEPQGKLVSTTATKVSGNHISFLHMDLSGLTELTLAKSKHQKIADKMDKEMRDRMWIEKAPVVEIRFDN